MHIFLSFSSFLFFAEEPKNRLRVPKTRCSILSFLRILSAGGHKSDRFSSSGFRDRGRTSAAKRPYQGAYITIGQGEQR